jgi:cell division septation protein DedD
MPGYFDEDEPEPERPRRDTEMTLGVGAMAGLVVGLVLLCGLCFVAGYAVGHRGSAPSAAANAPTAAPDQEPLQPNGSIPKPSASDQTAVPPPGDSPATPAEGDGANPTTAQQEPGAGGQGGSGQGAGGPGATTPGATQPVRPALPTAAPAVPGGAAPNVRAALPAQAKLMVQIAAVANGEDADVLMTALRKRGYSVVAARDPADGLIHVKIGPFNSRDEANRWRDKLLGDGYNAVVQP